MKLKWPLWQIVLVWFALHLSGFLSLAFGWLVPFGFIGGITFYTLFGIFTQSVGYGVIVGKRTLEEWKKQYSNTSGPVQPGGSTPRSRAVGYLIWLFLPVIIYVPFFIIAISER